MSLEGFLAGQRWFAGSAVEKAIVLEEEDLAGGARWAIVDADGVRYQVVLGEVDGHLADVAAVPEVALALLRRVAPAEDAQVVRPIGVDQSNTSLVFDERIVLKLFRRLADGPNPDVEVSEALAAAGFDNVAAPVATWFEGGTHLAIVQHYLAGGTEGWALALTSLRDLYGGDGDDPAASGGDFAAEARRLGAITARMHRGLADAFGRSPGSPREWIAGMKRQLARLDPPEPGAVAVIERLEAVKEGGQSIRVHGDYHLAQVLRTDAGWFVLDFEGEPARPVEDRRRPSSPLKDVAGMLRSFDYAAQVALRDQDEHRRADLASRATAWEKRNRGAFLEGYIEEAASSGLLPGDDLSLSTVLAAFELDKAVYELLYERAHRPDWAEIPRRAMNRLVNG